MNRALTVTIAIFISAPLLFPSHLFAEEPIMVAVSIAPQKYFAEKIGGSHVAVTVMVPNGADAHVYEPKPKQLMALSRSRLYFGIGLPFERAWLRRFKTANPRLVVVFTDKRIEKLPMTTHSHNHSKVHREHEGEPDPHVWLSPPLVKTIAESMYGALAAADTIHRSEYTANYRAFTAEIDTLDAELRRIFSSAKGRSRFMVFHPAWEYFAKAYGLEQIPVEIEGREPRPSELIELVKTAKALSITTLFVPPQISTRGAQAIADAIGGMIVYADPLAEDWSSNLRTAAMRFQEALR